jgi:hypothetical protein
MTPKEKLPRGWYWHHSENNGWVAQKGKHLKGGMTNRVWCSGGFCWDSCYDCVPVAVMVAVLRVAGAL